MKVKIKTYFKKDFMTSDNNEILSLNTHYYRSRKEEVIEAVNKMIVGFKAKVRSIDSERGEIVFDHLDYNGNATITAISFTEIAVDFNVFTFNFFPSLKGIKIIESFYKHLDKILPLHSGHRKQ